MRLVSKKYLIATFMSSTILSPMVIATAGAPDDAQSTYNGSVLAEHVPVTADRSRTAKSVPAMQIRVGDEEKSVRQRLADQAFAEADIRMSFDGLEVTPKLNVGLAGEGETVRPGTLAIFETYSNYEHWIKAREVRVFDQSDSSLDTPIATVLVDKEGVAGWQVPAESADSFQYVLRVYDENGHYDETIPKSFEVSARKELRANPTALSVSEIYGYDNTGLRNISVSGGSVTVAGKKIDRATLEHVRVFGKNVPFDAQGDFVAQQILPSGRQNVEVTISSQNGQVTEITREVEIPENDIFLIALGELTIGQRSDDGAEVLAAGGEDFDETFVNGRGAFYLKGKIKGKYLITASLDTTEDEVDNLFSNLDDKDPDSLLRRVDPDRFYPVYGDDSTYVEDAPTQGRFYVRVERGDDHVVWGNFLTNITGTEFAQIDRGLYGGKLEYNSDDVTSFGDRRARLTLFTADPGTLPSREEFRGTGGSVYFLQNQDLTIGSERLRIEIRDKNSGLVLETQDLKPQADYDIDYIQGRILLNSPLASTVKDDQIVRDGTLSGNNVYLVARYEFSPTLADIDGFTTGGRGEAWLGEHVRVGVTAQSEETGAADQDLVSGDIILRKSATTYVKGEFAETSGVGFDERASLDGGFTFDPLTNGAPNGTATAGRIEGAANFSDFEFVDIDGKMTAYYEDLEAGFSGAGRLTRNDIMRYGAGTSLEFSENNSLGVKYDHVEVDTRGEETTASLDIKRAMSARLSVGLGVRYSDRQGSAAVDTGTRTDAGLEVRYQHNEDVAIFGFVQDTLESDDTRAGGQRTGLGLETKLTTKLRGSVEVSQGDGGTGALAELAYSPEEGTEYYLNYLLDADRQESGIDGTTRLTNSQNALTVGGRKRYSDYLSVYGEERASFGNSQGLTHAYGLDVTPIEKLSIGVNFEIGDIEEDDILIEREAYTVSAGYTDEKITIGTAFEWRDDSTNGVSRETWLFRSNAGLQLSEDWRALAKFNHAESDSALGSFASADFTEAQLAGAYRPIENDRLNALFRYTYFRDLAPAQQFSSGGQNGLPAQRSQILSIDAQYDLYPWLSLGGKYGYRLGEVSLSRASEDFVDSTASLAILRGDLHFVHKWDGLLEYRMLDVEEAEDQLSGFLVALYRHVGDHAKIGVGYNFTEFSDDLTDFDFNNEGWFVNIIGKY